MQPKHTDDKRERFRTEKRRVIRTVLLISVGIFIVMGVALVWITGGQFQILLIPALLSISTAVIGIMQAPNIARQGLLEEWAKEQWPDSDER